MKKYISLGDLLLDYRKVKGISQIDFADNLNVDRRTILRWEKNSTLLNHEKENDLIQETLLPYQLIRNLNSLNPIPTYYDFEIRKYSLNEISNPLPDASWFKQQMHIKTDRIHKIDFNKDVDYLLKVLQSQKVSLGYGKRELINEAIKLLPELNIIITDESGYYSGHSIFLPLKGEVYTKLKAKEITEDQSKPNDLTNYKTQTTPFFYLYDITVDCNDNAYYLLNSIFRFFSKLEDHHYIVGSITKRHDTFELVKQFGMNIIWQDEKSQELSGQKYASRFNEGNFKKFLS